MSSKSLFLKNEAKVCILMKRRILSYTSSCPLQACLCQCGITVRNLDLTAPLSSMARVGGPERKGIDVE